MRSDYEDRKERRILSLLDHAEKLQRDAAAATSRGDAMLSVIPLGQPILIGHHSEKRDRNYRNRAFNALQKGHELSKHADEVQRRAEAAQENDSISSDDPEAVRKLKERIAELEDKQNQYRAINKCVRAKDRAGLTALGYSEALVEKFFQPDCCGRKGIPEYRMANNSANLRRLRQRLGQMERLAQDAAAGVERREQIGSSRMVSSAEDNRTKVFFPGKPPAEIIAQLKSWGFRWAPSQGAWMRHRSSSAEYWALEIMKKYAGAVNHGQE